MRRKRMHLYKKTGTYVLCMAKTLEINFFILAAVTYRKQSIDLLHGLVSM